jgi:dipeptidyl aminopeptidase/acylaminoacyl peptidase
MVNALFEADYTGKQVRVLTGLDMDLNLIDFDFHRQRIVFTAFKSERQKPVTSCVYTYDVLTDVLLKFTKSEYRIDGLKSMGEACVYFTGVDLRYANRNDNQQVYRIQLLSGEIDQVGPHLDMSNENPAIVTDSMFAEGSTEKHYKNTYYHLRVAEDRQVICLQEDGGRRCIDTGLKSITSFDVLEDAFYLIGMKDQKLLELYKYKEKDLIQLTDHNAWLDTYTLSRPRRMCVQTDQGEIRGWVYPPLNVQSESAPAVLMIHGGPKMVYSDVFAFDIQLLCAKGHYVLCANPMGSDGRGDAFADIRGQFCEVPYEQLMAFVDEVLDTFTEIDENALGVTGGSYGGYMTNHIITRTDRFRAAVSERGISNMLSALTASDIGFAYVAEYAGQTDLWSRPQVLLDMSPVLSAGAVKTPTLFNHGKEDFRCHYTESLNMYSALVQQGVPARLCLYEGENHSLVTRGRPKAKLTRYQELTRWFDRYLKRG